MEPLHVLLLIAVLAIVIGAAGHLIARYAWPARRRLWRRRALVVEQEAQELNPGEDLEKPEAGMGPGAGPVGGRQPLRERRGAGTGPEDIDY